jgi:hypothetical protein
MDFRFGLALWVLAAALSPACAEEWCSGHQFLQTPRPEASCQTLAPEIFVSPDGATHAVVLPVDVSLYTTPDMESRVVIHSSSGDTLNSEDHSSTRGENGHYVTSAKWSPDSEFFVYSLSSSGGHQPWSFPIMVFSRKRNAFATFSDMIHDEPTVSGDFEVSGPHTLTAKTWKKPGDLENTVPVSVDLEKAFGVSSPMEMFSKISGPFR